MNFPKWLRQDISQSFVKGTMICFHEWANPNRHGPVALISTLEENIDGTKSPVFTLWEASDAEWGDDEPFIDDYENEEIAKSKYDARVAELAGQPNWQAQAEYDEAHGTVNGYDPAILHLQELWGEY